MANRMTRRVLAQMHSSHNHAEFVELTHITVYQGTNDAEFFTDLKVVEERAREVMREQKGDGIGPWNDPVDSFELFAVFMTSVNAGPWAGRIAMGKALPTKEVVAPELLK